MVDTVSRQSTTYIEQRIDLGCNKYRHESRTEKFYKRAPNLVIGQETREEKLKGKSSKISKEKRQKLKFSVKRKKKR